MVVAGAVVCVGACAVLTASDRFLLTEARFFTTAFFGAALVAAGAATDLAGGVLPVATTATRAAVRAVAAAAVQRVSRLTRRSPAARARRLRVCS